MTNSKDAASVSEDNYILVDEDKFKEEQRVEVNKATEMFKRECLNSFSTTRASEVIKKFDFPTF